MAASSSTSSSKRGFLVKFALFALLVVGLDAGVGGVLRHFYFTQKSGLNYRTTYAVNESREDIIVLGSSRAQAHYVPEILESELDGTCYNAGRNGQSLLYAAAVHNARLARGAPKVVILDLILMDFYKYQNHYDRLAALLPYYRDSEAVRPFVLMRSPFERIKLASGIYPFNSLPLQILKYNLGKEKNDKGYVTIPGTIQLPLLPAREPGGIRNGIDPIMVETLEDLVAGCLENDIELYPVISPGFDGNEYGRDALKVVASVLEGTPYRLWDYSDHPDFIHNPEVFRDRDHLNPAGSKSFTEILAARISRERNQAHSLR